jgi:hypothetical protein
MRKITAAILIAAAFYAGRNWHYTPDPCQEAALDYAGRQYTASVCGKPNLEQKVSENQFESQLQYGLKVGDKVIPITRSNLYRTAGDVSRWLPTNFDYETSERVREKQLMYGTGAKLGVMHNGRMHVIEQGNVMIAFDGLPGYVPKYVPRK